MANFLFTSESVGIGHPDKIADQISDAVLDACLEQDPESRVACEVMVSTGLVMLGGEITTKANIDYQQIVRQTVKEIGYEDSKIGFDYRSCAVLVSINKQSPDISQGVSEGSGLFSEQGAGDQGMMFGFACDETEELMPLPLDLSQKILEELHQVRRDGRCAYLRPDSKAQVTVEYKEDFSPVRVEAVVLSTQHSEEVTLEKLSEDMQELIQSVIPVHLIDEKTKYYINPTGRFVAGGPAGDCGLTGRKLTVDTYGGMARHGGGAFSGKDPSKVDRSAAYAARYVAKNIVAAKIARRCEVQIAYSIGVAEPVSIRVDTFGTSLVDEALLTQAVKEIFDLSPKGIIEHFQLKRPIYKATAWGGHFGRSQQNFPWEEVDQVASLKQALRTDSKKNDDEIRDTLGASCS